jgi:ElaB/YqjD/DUF883 family membrane-anchored ribosome-binding protein
MPTNDITTIEDLAASQPSIGDKLSVTATRVLQKAATTLHENAESLPGGEKVSNLAHATAQKLGSTATYVRDNDYTRMMSDVKTVVKNNPGRSLLVGVVIGFLTGRMFTKTIRG